MTNMNFGPSEYLYGPGLGGLYAGEQTALNFDAERLAQRKTLEDIAKAQQDREFSAQKNPLELERMRGENALYPGKLEELGIKNKTASQKLDRDKWNAFMDDLMNVPPDMMGPERAAYFDDVRKRHGIDAEHPMFGIAIRASSDPQQFQKLREATRISPEKLAEMKSREEAAAASAASHERIAGMQGRTQKEIMQMQIDAGRFQKTSKIVVGLENELAKAQGAVNKLAVVNQYIALANTDPELAPMIPQLKALAAQLEPQAQAEINKMKPPGINTPAVTGLPANQPPPLVPQSTPPGQAPKPMAAPPAGAIQMLRQNPNMAAAFDAKYGQGAAAKVLQGQ